MSWTGTSSNSKILLLHECLSHNNPVLSYICLNHRDIYLKHLQYFFLIILTYFNLSYITSVQGNSVSSECGVSTYTLANNVITSSCFQLEPTQSLKKRHRVSAPYKQTSQSLILKGKFGLFMLVKECTGSSECLTVSTVWPNMWSWTPLAATFKMQQVHLAA